MKKWLLLTVAVLMFVIAGCGDSEEKDVDESASSKPEESTNSEPDESANSEADDINEEEAEAALDVLFKNIEYANAQDVDGYLKAIPEEDQEMTKDAVQQMFDEGKTEMEIVDYEVLSTDEEVVEIGVVQTTVAIDEIEGMEDNILEIIHTLVVEDGDWKIAGSEITGMEPYEQ